MSDANAAQAQFWNGDVSQRWLRLEPVMERLLAQVTDLVLKTAAPGTGERVLELGCGAGRLALALGGRVGTDGKVMGLDISAPLLGRAAERARAAGLSNMTFTCADAQEAPLPPAAFDMVVSQFGAMFFADPVRAYQNLRTGLRPGGRLVLAVWGNPAENALFSLPKKAAEGRLGPAEPAPPEAPGPFALAAPTRIAAILQDAGFSEISVTPTPLMLCHPEGLDAVLPSMTTLGPVAGMMRDKGGTEADLAAITAAIAQAMQPFVTPEGIAIPALINLVQARNPG